MALEEVTLFLRFSSFDAYMLNDLMKLKLKRETANEKKEREANEVMTKVAIAALMFSRLQQCKQS